MIEVTVEETIKQAWSKYPEAVVSYTELSQADRKPRLKTVPKNEIRIFVKNRHGRGQIVYVFRGALEVTLDYRKGQGLETALESGHLDDEMVLPNKDTSHYCPDCREFTVSLYHSRKDGRLVCLDCFKAEKKKLEGGE